MSIDATTDRTTSPENSTTPSKPHITWQDSYSQAHIAIEALSSILQSIPPSLSKSETPAFSLLHDPETADLISQRLRHPDSGAGDDNLCRWLYDTFQTSQPDLHLVVLRFLPIIAGAYLSRVTLHKPLAGFEAILLALYANETTSRNGQPVTVSIPDLSHSSIYHETKQTSKNSATELNLAVISPSLEPHGNVRSTRRARIVGIALELYYSKISQIPVGSKIDFCEFCRIWSGHDGTELESPGSTQGKEIEGEILEKKTEVKRGRISLPWELLQPVLRILGHCLMGPNKDKELYEAACAASRSLYTRALHDINSNAILATRSLLKLVKLAAESNDDIDHTEITFTNVITI
ncbi:Hyccin [Abeliophyllum distichum]|uniref:Hyccin n=1 Tax=Abeliophyllum distichum TaxID=126358 RepID=A0ABD1ULG0_9LAMI